MHSMSRRRFGLSGRSPACACDHCGRTAEAGILRHRQGRHGAGGGLGAVRAFRRDNGARPGLNEFAPAAGRTCTRRAHRRGVPVHGAARDHSDFRARFIAGHSERKPGLRARSIPRRMFQWRPHHTCTRSAMVRKKYNRHEQNPSALVGHSCGASPSPHITPIAGPFPGDIHAWTYVPGSLAGDIGRKPGTCARCPGRTPPNSHEKSAPARCVVGWVESGYVERAAHDTRHLSSCLVTSSGISRQLRGGSGG